MTTNIEILRDVEMKTRDGVVLRADVYRPAVKDKLPAIMIRTPYDKSSEICTGRVGYLRVLEAAFAGFAVVVQDVRGRFASEGDYEPFGSAEGPDGYDAIEWAASEAWCNGRIGMMGGSYSALAQLIAAQEQPPSLRCIIPEKGAGSSVRGAIQLDSTLISWAALQAVDAIQRRMKEGLSTAEDLRVATAALYDPQSVASHLPLDDLPFMRIPGLPSYSDMVKLMLSAVPTPDFSKIIVPTFMTSGWYDIGPHETSACFADLRLHGGSREARDGSCIWFGPWDHGLLNSMLGEWFFGNHAAGVLANLPGKELAFFSKWLRDDDSATVPTATYFVMGANVWKEASEWPPPGAKPTELFLSSGGRANTSSGDGKLARDPPAEQPPDRYDYDPANPVPAWGGRFFAHGGSIPGPFDQARIERRPDVLVYTSDTVDSPLEIGGDLSLTLHIASSAVDTDFIAKLCDVAPDGTSHNIADGFLRCRWRDGFDKEVWLEPGSVYEIVIDLGPVAHRFLADHRIRLQVMSSNFPAWDRNMNTGNPLGSDARGAVAHQTVFHGGARASMVTIPIVPAD